jgi:glycosyltransferase involved in cell wall biosynthesis
MIDGITVVIPTIPPREALLRRAMDSVDGATARMADAYGSMVPVRSIVVQDQARNGAAKTRHQGLLAVETEHVAFLDDDDVMHPDHLVQLYGAALDFQADYLWSRFQIIKEHDRWVLCSGPVSCNAPYEHKEFGGGYGYGHHVLASEVVQGPVFLGDKAFSQWDDNDPCQTTITTLVRTELALAAGGFAQFEDDGSTVDGNRRGEDHEFTLRCRAAGGAFRHVPRVTWDWYHHSANTSGMPVW